MKSITSQQILQVLREYNKRYEKEGFQVVGLFGSYARGQAEDFSDIDLVYRIDHDRFHPGDAFKKLEEVQKIRRELEAVFRRPVDLIPYPSKISPLKTKLERELLSA